MKHLILLAGAAVALAPAAFAGPRPQAAPATVKCPVMTGRDVNVKDATAHKMYADYKGNRYYLCCNYCVKAFNANPAKYASNAHLPVPAK